MVIARLDHAFTTQPCRQYLDPNFEVRNIMLQQLLILVVARILHIDKESTKVVLQVGRAGIGVRSRVLLGDPLGAFEIDGQELPRAAKVARVVGDEFDDPFSAGNDVAEPLFELAGSDASARRFDAIQPGIRLAQQATTSSPSSPRFLCIGLLATSPPYSRK